MGRHSRRHDSYDDYDCHEDVFDRAGDAAGSFFRTVWNIIKFIAIFLLVTWVIAHSGK